MGELLNLIKFPSLKCVACFKWRPRDAEQFTWKERKNRRKKRPEQERLNEGSHRKKERKRKRRHNMLFLNKESSEMNHVGIIARRLKA